MPQRSGSLVFFSSGALAGMPSMTSYATAKAGILGFTWSTAYALESYGIRTNCVVPSAATRMSDDIYGGAGVLSDEVGETVRSELAAGTYRDPATVAPLVVYLLSDASAEINGQVLRIQGYEVSRMAELAWDRSMTSDGPWDVTSMAERLPIDLGPQLTPKPVRWPQPKR
jgi:NAD(P)-dependent dehydrogenase (short-subunit alcohol dehydrogenase family)